MADASRERTYGQWWDWDGPFVTLPIDEVRAFGEAAYRLAGASAEDAAFLFGNGLDKAIQGDHARGLVYFPNQIRGALAGTTDLKAPIGVVRERGATAVVSGGKTAPSGLVCREAMKLAIAKAREFGVGIVGATGGAGLLTPFVMMAVEAGMVGIVLTQTGPAVAPIGGYQPLLGNGPLAVGIPSRNRDPVVLDMSFTQSSASGVLLSASQGVQIPPGLLLDQHGEPSTDPRDLTGEAHEKAGSLTVTGSLTPLGGGHKGFAMLFVIGLLASVLSDTSPPWELAGDVTERGTHGSVLIAIDAESMNPNDLPGRVDAFIDKVTGAPRKDGVEEILYPGQRSQQLKRERKAGGMVDLPRPHVEAMVKLAGEIGLDLPPSFVTAGA